jgi:hypothetical protein
LKAATKNGEDHTIPLSVAAGLIDTVPALQAVRLSSPATGNTPISWSRAKEKLTRSCLAARKGSADRGETRQRPAQWRIHD